MYRSEHSRHGCQLRDCEGCKGKGHLGWLVGNAQCPACGGQGFFHDGPCKW